MCPITNFTLLVSCLWNFSKSFDRRLKTPKRWLNSTTIDLASKFISNVDEAKRCLASNLLSLYCRFLRDLAPGRSIILFTIVLWKNINYSKMVFLCSTLMVMMIKFCNIG